MTAEESIIVSEIWKPDFDNFQFGDSPQNINTHLPRQFRTTQWNRSLQATEYKHNVVRYFWLHLSHFGDQITKFIPPYISAFFVAEEESNKNMTVTCNYSYIIGMIIGSILITIIGTGLTYLGMKRLTKKLSKSEYDIDDIESEKDGSQYYDSNENYIISEMQNLYEIKPILTVSEVVSSVKQSFDDLGDVLIPNHWLTRKHMVNQDTSVKDEKNDLPI
ncbi:unnamed protein product [Adineta steineri]|uniref:Uncharacterized protein n=1 Tax=Adineta steineri TaxID=433720 RepID=A0A814F3T2_9BILA|nr:unnamed protein product [Adineta steineri]CAF1364498.1 unnamed protein product [Adineta steineri]